MARSTTIAGYDAWVDDEGRVARVALPNTIMRRKRIYRISPGGVLVEIKRPKETTLRRGLSKGTYVIE